MGCGSSKDSGDAPGPAKISGSQGEMVLLPAPRRDDHGIPVTHQHYDFDRVHLERALGYAAEYLHEQRADIVITAVG